MNIYSKTLISSILFLGAVQPAKADDSLKEAWLGLIKAELPAKCDVSIIKIGTVLSGNNGLRDEQWFVQTCVGNREYWVYFYPPAVFPDRHSPYAVVRVNKKSG